MVVEGRSLGKSPADTEAKLTLRFKVRKKEVLVEKAEGSNLYSVVGSVEASSRLSLIACKLLDKGEAPEHVERVLRHVTDSLDLPTLADFADTASAFIDSLHKPLFWMEKIADHVSKSRTSSLGTFRLFDEAKNVQGTDSEQLLLRSMVG